MLLRRKVKLLVALVVVFALSAHAAIDTSATLRFPRRHLIKDDWIPAFQSEQPVRKRWEKVKDSIEHDPVNMEEKLVKIHDATAMRNFTVSSAGFELVELHPRLFPVLKRIKAEGLGSERVGPPSNVLFGVFLGGETASDRSPADELASMLQGFNSFRLNGDTVNFALSCAGFVIRKGGPDGASLGGSGYDNVAHRVHIDQDIRGEPLRSLGVTWLFQLPFMRLLNVWTPLQDVHMRPMAFADRTTVNMTEDVVRFRANSTKNAGGLKGSFESDRLMSLYSDKHKWYWYPNVRFGQAIAFDTSDVPHSSFSIPGEDTLMSLRKHLMDLKDDPTRACVNKSTEADPVEKLLRERLSDEQLPLDMVQMMGIARTFIDRMCSFPPEKRAQVANSEEYLGMLEQLTRASIEIRCATAVFPKHVAYIGALLIFVFHYIVLYRLIAKSS